MKISWKPLKLHENLRVTLKFDEILRNFFLKFHEKKFLILQKSPRNLLKFLKVFGNPLQFYDNL